MASRPATPPNQDPEDAADYRFKTNGTPCEWGESYHPGGYHPVHLGDVLQDRYRIIRKLGYGSFSTAWLAADLKTDCFVALKVAVACLSKEGISLAKNEAVYRTFPQDETWHVVCLRDVFEIEGPNGRHTCLALDPMGPHLSALLKRQEGFQINLSKPFRVKRARFPTPLTKRILRDVLLGLGFVHNHGVVHGDLHPGNILFTIPPLGKPLTDPTSEQDLQQLPSQGTPLQRRDGKPDPWAPSYLVAPAPLQEDHVSFDLDPLVKITDLGAAFFSSHPPPAVVTPVALRAPESILSGTWPLGKGIDIWSSGCLVFELLTGSPLFIRLEALDGCAEFDEETNDEHLIQLSEVLGLLPEEFAARWRRRDRYYGPDGERLEGDMGDYGDDSEGSDSNDNNGDDGRGRGIEDEDDNDGAPDSPTSMSSHPSSSLACPGTFASLETRLRDQKPEDMSESEVDEVSRLLRWILKYDPSRRPSAEEILQHPWFSV